MNKDHSWLSIIQALLGTTSLYGGLEAAGTILSLVFTPAFDIFC